MFIIENLNSEIIEKKMGFKFSELELVGKCDSKNNNSATINVIYKDKKQLFIFSIRDNKIISINKITRDEQAKSMKSYFFTVSILASQISIINICFLFLQIIVSKILPLEYLFLLKYPIICKSLNLKSNLSSIFFLIFSPLTNIIYNTSPLH